MRDVTKKTDSIVTQFITPAPQSGRSVNFMGNLAMDVNGSQNEIAWKNE